MKPDFCLQPYVLVDAHLRLLAFIPASATMEYMELRLFQNLASVKAEGFILKLHLNEKRNRGCDTMAVEHRNPG
jgi:hypothetical protein